MIPKNGASVYIFMNVFYTKYFAFLIWRELPSKNANKKRKSEFGIIFFVYKSTLQIVKELTFYPYDKYAVVFQKEKVHLR